MVCGLAQGLSKALSAVTETKVPLDHATLALVRRLLRDHVRPHFGRIVFALVCMALASAAIAALARLMEPVLDDVFIRKDQDTLYWVASLVFTVFVIKGLATYGQAVTMNYVGLRIIADLQIRMFAHLMRADLAFFHNTSAGSLVSRFINDVNLLRGTVSTALTSIGKDSLTLAFLVGVMFYQDWALALVALFAFPTAVVPVVKIGQRMRRVSASTQVEMGHFTTLLDESFQGARHVKAYGMEAYETSRAAGVVNAIFRLVYKAARTRLASHPIMETLGGVAIVAVIVYGGYQVIGEAKTPGALFSFITALLLAYEPMKRLANLNANLQEGLAAAQRVFAMLDVEPEIQDRPGATPLVIRGGAIRFEDVHFSYAPGRPALNGVSLEVPAGKTVALVGPTGAGKSTILNLIPRFYDAGGRVTIDGTDLREVTLASLRASIGLVSQEISLFDDTIRANIAYGKLEAGEDKIIEAARHAGAHDFIMALPDGYATRVGGQVVKLSGGQRQRLAIARAMLKNAPILLLDEATSALDTETERQVQRALANLMRGRTTLVIAHRLSTIVAADLIHVIERGRVVESGSHDELLARGQVYARLYATHVAEERRKVEDTQETEETQEAEGTRARA